MMNAQPVSPDSGPQDTPLTRVNFSQPQCRYESVADYTNSLGQVFRLVASGTDQGEVDVYIQDIKVDIKVLPYQELPQAETYSSSDRPDQDQEKSDAVDLQFEVVESPGLEPPYLVEFIIDPPINAVSAVPHTHTYHAKSIQVSVRSNDEELKRASLRRSGATIISPRNLAANLSGSAGSVVVFQVAVTGRGRYTVSGKYTN